MIIIKSHKKEKQKSYKYSSDKNKNKNKNKKKTKRIIKLSHKFRGGSKKKFSRFTSSFI